MIDDELEEIDLSPRRTTQERSIRAGIKRALASITDDKKRPFWKRQLRGSKGGKVVHKKHIKGITK